MSLYRKYRPQTFADVIGQDHVVTTLENAVAQGKLAHAYLFAGGRGTGKTTVARILAKILLLQGVEDEALKQQMTQGIEEGHLVDLVEIDAASNRGIDDVRELIEKIQFSPVVSKAKVYIIDEVHMLTREAFNALLKTLEEPPAYAYFILATTELQKIPATIQSRCQRFAFRQITEDDLVRGLQRIVDAEKINVERPALRAVAHSAQGGMRDAITLLDQLRSLPQVTLADVQQRTGETGQEHVEHVFEALQNGDRNALIAVVRKVEDAGIALDVFGRQLLAEARTRLYAAAEGKGQLGDAVGLVEALLSAIRNIRVSPVPGLALEAALLRLTGVETTPAPQPVPAKPRTIMQKITGSDPAPTVAASPVKKEVTEKPATHTTAPPPTAAGTAGAEIEAPDVSLKAIQAEWTKMLNDIPTPSVKMSLKNGRASEVKNLTVRIAFSSAFHRDKVKQTDASRQVEEVLAKHFKRPLKIECVLDGGSSTIAAQPDQGMVNLAEAASEVF